MHPLQPHLPSSSVSYVSSVTSNNRSHIRSLFLIPVRRRNRDRCHHPTQPLSDTFACLLGLVLALDSIAEPALSWRPGTATISFVAAGLVFLSMSSFSLLPCTLDMRMLETSEAAFSAVLLEQESDRELQGRKCTVRRLLWPVGVSSAQWWSHHFRRSIQHLTGNSD